MVIKVIAAGALVAIAAGCQSTTPSSYSSAQNKTSVATPASTPAPAPVPSPVPPVVSPPAAPNTFIAYGRITLGSKNQGASPAAGFLVTNQTTGVSVVSTSDGQFSLPGSKNGDHVTFEKAGYEPYDWQIVNYYPYDDNEFTVQPVVRVAAGEQASSTIEAFDTSYVLGNQACNNCRLIRVVCPAAGTLHLQIAWGIPDAYFSLRTAIHRYTYVADLAVDAGEVVVYVQAGTWFGGSFTLATRLDGGLRP